MNVKLQEQLHGKDRANEADLSGNPLEIRSIANECKLDHSVENKSVEFIFMALVRVFCIRLRNIRNQNVRDVHLGP